MKKDNINSTLENKMKESRIKTPEDFKTKLLSSLEEEYEWTLNKHSQQRFNLFKNITMNIKKIIVSAIILLVITLWVATYASSIQNKWFLGFIMNKVDLWYINVWSNSIIDPNNWKEISVNLVKLNKNWEVDRVPEYANNTEITIISSNNGEFKSMLSQWPKLTEEEQKLIKNLSPREMREFLDQKSKEQWLLAIEDMFWSMLSPEEESMKESMTKSQFNAYIDEKIIKCL